MWIRGEKNQKKFLEILGEHRKIHCKSRGGGQLNLFIYFFFLSGKAQSKSKKLYENYSSIKTFDKIGL